MRPPAGTPCARAPAGLRQPCQYPVRLLRAEVVLSLDADFLGCGAGSLRYTRDFTNRRRVEPGKDGPPPAMNRLYVVECMLSSTGGVADHRLPLRNTEIASFAVRLAGQLGVSGVPAAGCFRRMRAPGWTAAGSRPEARRAGAL